MNSIDLTPFGFTQTENLAYGALLEFGPSSGYALAKRLNIARANAYQALNGLAKKSAATATDDRPQKYRPVRPDALLAHLSNVEAEKLDRLEHQIRQAPSAAGESLVPIEGRRALVTVAMRTAGRESGGLSCIGSVDLLASIAPAWRRRAADGLETRLWTVGESGDLPVEPVGTIPADRLASLFEKEPFLLSGTGTWIAAQVAGEDTVGYWATQPTIGALVGATFRALTGE